ncbi:MAG TPA: hypothetical protein VFV87_19505, partial [Pirellulaceae bacterium]|nr:hypothetical protein [Pirellulaceae bacterium]
MQRLALVEFFLPGGKKWPGQRQAKQEYGRSTEHEEDDVANLQNAAVALHRLPQKVHGRPLHYFVTPTIEQVDNQRRSSA